MRKKNLFVSTVVLVIAWVIIWHAYTGTPLRRSKEKIAYDHTILTEAGIPIKVARVIDGDTIELINGDRLRYIGIDTPEEVDPRKPVQCFAAEAAEKNKELVEGKMITFFKDVPDRDRYGRFLGFVYDAEGTFVNVELVQQGYAFAYPFPPDISKARKFTQAENDARAHHRGLWSKCSVEKNSFGRTHTNPVAH